MGETSSRGEDWLSASLSDENPNSEKASNSDVVRHIWCDSLKLVLLIETRSQ